MTTIQVGQLEIRYLRDGSLRKETGAFEMTVPPSAQVPPPHSHTENEEYLYVLEGRLRCRVNEEVRDLSPGESMFTPKGGVHEFSNPFSAPARALVVLSPDIGSKYFEEIAGVLGGGGPPDRAKIVQIMSQYGLKLA
jgi:quercetin dioxygenase-like cupin family protein